MRLCWCRESSTPGLKMIADREKLAERYRGQLSYYAQALEQLTGRTVKTQVIYSFFLGKEIVLSGTEGV